MVQSTHPTLATHVRRPENRKKTLPPGAPDPDALNGALRGIQMEISPVRTSKYFWFAKAVVLWRFSMFVTKKSQRRFESRRGKAPGARKHSRGLARIVTTRFCLHYSIFFCTADSIAFDLLIRF